MGFKSFDDIEREREKAERIKRNTEISEDINDVFDNVFRRPKSEPEAPKKSFYSKIKWFIVFLILFMFALNLLLLNAWLLKFFIKSLFLGG